VAVNIQERDMTLRQRSHAYAGVGRLALTAGLALGLAATADAAQQTNEIANSQDTANVQQAAVPGSAKVGVTDAMMTGADKDKADWLLHGRDYSNQRYSPLSQISTANIDQLKPAAIVQTGMVASFETTPVVVDGVMYASTPMVDNKMKVMALNAATGARYWQTTYDIGTAKLCCGPVNRGVAVGYGTVYLATVDAKLLALDAKTGKKEWEAQLADPQAGFSETMAPQIYNGMVIVGSSGGEWPIRGFVAAYDAKTGKQKWRWQATDPKTFAGDSWKTGGGMVWTTPAIDEKRGLLIFSTGNPNPDLDGTTRAGNNLYTDSIVALDVASGKLKWAYQEVKHDVWDYDAVSNVVLFDAKDAEGKTVPAAGEAGKVGWLFVVNRDTGKLIRKSDPLVKMSKNMFTTPTKAGVQMLPGANGGAEWSPPAYSPETHDFYVMEMNQLMTFTTDNATQTIPGQIRLGSTFKNVKGDTALQDGVLDAVNVDTGAVDWKYHAPQPMIGGVLATGGNLVFTGEGNGMFDAFDAKSGKKVWSFNLGAGVNAPPITYEVDGQQYIAVAAGGNFQLDYPRGDAIAIFKLDLPS
jgi:PQQ-dependent dehydrogenase (methanol/ethanol family)